jgi:hypothetical protein
MSVNHQEIRVPAGQRMVPADLIIPTNASCVVIFSHAGINSRENRLNKVVAGHLQKAGIGTFLGTTGLDFMQRVPARLPRYRPQQALTQDRGLKSI